jgi:hypothetical protein
VAGAASAASPANACRSGATSRANRCSVQSPPRSTFIGSAGSGMIEPKDVWLLANSKLVT